MSYPLISPSLLAADQLNLESAVHAVTKAGADHLHIDVMDGHYVPNITYGPDLVKALSGISSLPLDVHLMIKPVSSFVDAYIDAGATTLTFHPEADAHPHRTLTKIRQRGVKAGLALNPGTPIAVLESLWSVLDTILIMSVNPGFSGQQFIPETLDKIKALRTHIKRHNLPIQLAVDGGVTTTNSSVLHEAGANILVVGSGLFKFAETEYSSIIAALKGN